MGTAPKTTKDRILFAALELFARDGYEGVGMQQIAQATGIKAPSIYKHYKGKRDIFDAIIRRMEQLDAKAAESCNLPVAPPDKAPSAYARSNAADLVTFARRQFRFWTEAPFASAFRRMLTIEQFRSPRMSALYRGISVPAPSSTSLPSSDPARPPSLSMPPCTSFTPSTTPLPAAISPKPFWKPTCPSGSPVSARSSSPRPKNKEKNG